MQIEGTFIGIVVALFLVTAIITGAMIVPRNYEDVVWCQSNGGVPMTDDGVLRACLKPEAVMEVPNNAD